MINTKKMLLVVFAILIPTIAVFFSFFLKRGNQEDVMGEQTEQQGCTPYVTNMIPNLSYVGQEYIYVPKVVGCDIDEVEMEFEGVTWLTLSQDGIISGTPLQSDVGIHRVILTVTSSFGKNKYVEYIIVE